MARAAAGQYRPDRGRAHRHQPVDGGVGVRPQVGAAGPGAPAGSTTASRPGRAGPASTASTPAWPATSASGQAIRGRLAIRLCRMRFDHPDDHPDDPSRFVWNRLDRRAIQPGQPRSVWSRPVRRPRRGCPLRCVGSVRLIHRPSMLMPCHSAGIDQPGRVAPGASDPATLAWPGGRPKGDGWSSRLGARGVIYQIYPHSWMDNNGDGVGDLPASWPGSTTSPGSGWTRSGSRRCTCRPAPTSATTWPTTPRSTPCSGPWRTWTG